MILDLARLNRGSRLVRIGITDMHELTVDEANLYGSGNQFARETEAGGC